MKKGEKKREREDEREEESNARHEMGLGVANATTLKRSVAYDIQFSRAPTLGRESAHRGTITEKAECRGHAFRCARAGHRVIKLAQRYRRFVRVA